eukprot:14405963-Ditylum_brightwellii.AAC.1
MYLFFKYDYDVEHLHTFLCISPGIYVSSTYVHTGDNRVSKKKTGQLFFLCVNYEGESSAKKKEQQAIHPCFFTMASEVDK